MKKSYKSVNLAGRRNRATERNKQRIYIKREGLLYTLIFGLGNILPILCVEMEGTETTLVRKIAAVLNNILEVISILIYMLLLLLVKKCFS